VGDGCGAPAAAGALLEGRTRKRRKVAPEGVRKRHKMGKWWRVYGYGGEVCFGLGRTVASEVEAPIMLGNLLWSG
jgi:hypothetical protein